MADASLPGGFFRRSADRLGALTVGFFVLVTMASGGTGLTLLLWPRSTDVFFSWELNPVAGAAVIGGLYLASALVFAVALTLTWVEARSLCVGVYGLTVPTLISTFVHDELFDFGRWQAVTWWVLFIAAPPAISVVLMANRHRPAPRGRPMAASARSVFGVIALGFGLLGFLILFHPTRSAVSDRSPFLLFGLTGAYLGAWCTFLAVLAGWAALRGTWRESQVPSVALVGAAAGGILASLRTFGALATGSRLLYMVCLLALGAVGAALWRAGRETTPALPNIGSPDSRVGG